MKNNNGVVTVARGHGSVRQHRSLAKSQEIKRLTTPLRQLRRRRDRSAVPAITTGLWRSAIGQSGYTGPYDLTIKLKQITGR